MTTEHLPLYAERNPCELEPHYKAHVIAMTREGLHDKSEIAAELAWRDQQIAELRTQLATMQERAHTCGPNCSRAGCVNARLRAEVEALTGKPEPVVKESLTTDRQPEMAEPEPPLRFCSTGCGEGVTSFCRGKTEVCVMGLPKLGQKGGA